MLLWRKCPVKLNRGRMICQSAISLGLAFQQIKCIVKMEVVVWKHINLMNEVFTVKSMKIREFLAHFPHNNAKFLTSHRSIYAIFSGQGGSQVAEFSMQRIAAEILLGQLNEKGATEEDVKEVLRQAFVSAEKGYLDSIDSNLARKTVLQCELEGLSQYEVSCN